MAKHAQDVPIKTMILQIAHFKILYLVEWRQSEEFIIKFSFASGRIQVESRQETLLRGNI